VDEDETRPSRRDDEQRSGPGSVSRILVRGGFHGYLTGLWGRWYAGPIGSGWDGCAVFVDHSRLFDGVGMQMSRLPYVTISHKRFSKIKLRMKIN
jgi:hypothetical protein